jgi:hypothetical protein
MGKYFFYFFLILSSIYGVLRRHDVTDQEFCQFGLNGPFSDVGMVECSIGKGTGTLIDPRTVLTAAHVTGNCKIAYFTLYSAFGIPKKVIRGEVFTHDRYYQRKCLGSNTIQENCNDLALIRLKERVNDVLPGEISYSPVKDYILCYGAGFGFTGTGLNCDFKDDGQKRGFTNILEGEYPWNGPSRYLQISFDSPQNLHTTSLEGVGAFGDSGAPIFIDIENKKQLIGVISMLTLDKSYGAKNLLIPIADYKEWIETNRFTKHGFPSGNSNDWDDPQTWLGEIIPQNNRFEFYEILLKSPVFLRMEKPHTIDFLKIDHKDAYLELLRPLSTSKLEISSGSLKLSQNGLDVAKIEVEGPAYLGGHLFIECHEISYREGDQVPLIKAQSIQGTFQKVSIYSDMKCHLVYTSSAINLLFGEE